MSGIIGNIKGSDIVEEDDGSVTFTAGAQLDGDGANGQFGEPPCYAPKSYAGKTLDVLANAGGPGNPSNKLGEISLACAKAIGVPVGEGSTHPANSGGVDADSHIIHYRLFPGVAAMVNGVTYPLQPS